MLFLMKNFPGPPGFIMQKINAFLHKEPIASIAYCLYWSVFFLLLAPAAVVFLLVQLLANLFSWITGKKSRNRYSPKNEHYIELAIVVTGCDTGIGKEIASVAAEEGFIVFAGCLKMESLRQFRQDAKIIPFMLDVTSDKSVARAFDLIEGWLYEHDETHNLKHVHFVTAEDTYMKRKSRGRRRVLHALINNAGVGSGGQVDWLDMSAFQKDMDVNYTGLVRCCKSFLPFFKQQAIGKTHTEARILNVISQAGIIAGPGMTPYFASKHAALAFTAGLRMELKAFGIQVAAVNPSFHESPLVHSIGDMLTSVWTGLPEEKRKEYGEEFFERYRLAAVEGPGLALWKVDVVIDQVLGLLRAQHIPGEVAIGSDARFIFPVIRMLPVWIRDQVQLNACARLPPAAMLQS